MSSFLADAAAQGETTVTTFANDLVESSDGMSSGLNTICSSRLIPASIYSKPPESVGTAFKQLVTQGIQTRCRCWGYVFVSEIFLWSHSKFIIHIG